MTMNYKAKLSYFVSEGDKEKFVRLEIPVYGFEVDGGANRNIVLSTTNDISLTSEMEQARAYKNIMLWLWPGKKFDTTAFNEMTELANKETTLNVLFAVERYSGAKMLEGIALIDREAGVYPPHNAEKMVRVDFWIPSAKLYYGKLRGTTIIKPQEM